MRKIMLLAAVVAASWMLSQPAEARDRGFGFRHFSGHAAPKLHLRHHGFKFHHGGFVGKPRAFKSRHFGHFGHRGFSSNFGHAPGSSRDISGTSASAVWCSSSATATSCSGSVMCRISSIITSATGTITGCSSGSTSGTSGRGTIAALPLEIGMAFRGTARACRAHRAARVAGCTAPRRPKPSLDSSSKLGFRHVPELCTAEIPEDRAGSVASAAPPRPPGA
jgi:hypothetical protein